MTKYNPMETAPKDGTIILVWNVEKIAQWDEKGNLTDPEIVGEWKMVSWMEDSVNYPNGYIGWRWCQIGTWQDEQGGYETAGNPVCWTPLPEAPDGYR